MKKVSAFSTDLGVEPSLEWIYVTDLIVDKRYQRAMGEKNQRHARRIARDFCWNHYQPIIVTEAGEKYAVIDGQHRLAAAKLHPFIDQLPCYVVDAPDVATQARIFVATNSQRIGLSRIQKFWAAHAGGEEWAVTIHDLCKDAGVTILRGPPSYVLPASSTLATYTLQKLLPLGRKVVADALALLISTHGDVANALRSPTIAAVARIVKAEPAAVEKGLLHRRLKPLDLENIIAEAKRARITGGGSLEAAVERVLRIHCGLDKVRAAA